jgi:hypothetical protein
MFASSNARRVRAIVLALVVTFVTNYAISYTAKANNGVPAALADQAQVRSGNTTPPVGPKP